MIRAWAHLVKGAVRGRLADWIRLLRRYQRRGPVDVLFASACPGDAAWVVSTHRAAVREGWRCAFVTVEEELCPTDTPDAWFPLPLPLWPLLRADTVVTASSGLSRAQLPRARVRIHMPHSMVSLHMAYPAHAFDGYDVLFACGPHHVDESRRLRELRPSFRARADSIGYGRMDLLTKAPGGRERPEKPLILIAPSWGPANLLARLGNGLVRALLALGARVVIRPHPQAQAETLAGLSGVFGAKGENVDLEVETSMRLTGSALERADLLITDFSGVSFEYAYCRERPALFIEGPPKVNNPSWGALAVPPLEIQIRDRLGVVVAPHLDDIVGGVRRLLAEAEAWRPRIQQTLAECVFAPGQCADRASARLKEILEHTASGGG